MLYVQLDANWPDNPKIIEAGWEAAGVHAAIMCVAKRLETDGWVHRAILRRMDVTDAVLDRLVANELLEVDGSAVRVNDWHDRNPSQGAIAAIRASKAEAGKKGNHDRWNHPFPFDTCPKCHPVAGCDPVGSDPYRTPTKSNPEVPTAIASAIDSPNPGAYRLSDEDTASFMAGLELVRAENGIERKTTGAA